MKTKEKLLQELEDMGCEVSTTGSRFICDPPVMDADEDYLVLIPENYSMNKFSRFMIDKFFVVEGNSNANSAGTSSNGQNFFKSFRHGTLNFIVTSNREFATKHKLATSLCKRLNLMNKDDRIAVFRAILYGEEYGENYQLFSVIRNEGYLPCR